VYECVWVCVVCVWRGRDKDDMTANTVGWWDKKRGKNNMTLCENRSRKGNQINFQKRGRRNSIILSNGQWIKERVKMIITKKVSMIK